MRQYPDFSPFIIEKIAEIAHEANKAYCESMGDDTQPHWRDAPSWQQESAINGVRFHVENPNSEASDSHENWFKEKQADGWSYGPIKDPERRQHPCMVPFNELPAAQQIKDHIFRNVVHGAAQYYIMGQ